MGVQGDQESPLVVIGFCGIRVDLVHVTIRSIMLLTGVSSCHIYQSYSTSKTTRLVHVKALYYRIGLGDFFENKTNFKKKKKDNTPSSL